MMIVVFVLLVGFANGHQNQAGYGAKSPPGVPPQQYQHQPPQYQQQYQQPPPQHQQQPPPQHQQQPPPQHQQQQPHHQQQQFQQGGAQQQQHHGHGGPQRPLSSQNMQHEKEHIKDHLEIPADTSQMSEQELQFHYFKMHDADNNDMLDGTELVKSLIHWHDAANHDPSQGQVPEQKIFTDEELVQMIDPILLQDDRDNDGYIDYAEFQIAQAQAAQAATRS